jgi:uncharacterized protein (TIGR02145 family)
MQMLQAITSNDYKAYGSLFQWGRKADGHELINWTNGTTGNAKYGTVKGYNNDPKDTKFIVYKINALNASDWRLKSDDILWENESGANIVCPVGYRLPTAGLNGTNKEWEVEVDSWHTDNAHAVTRSSHALASTIKLPMPGIRDRITGAVEREGDEGFYWSASVDVRKSTYRKSSVRNARDLAFNWDYAARPHDSNKRRFGFSVRCIKN